MLELWFHRILKTTRNKDVYVLRFWENNYHHADHKGRPASSSTQPAIAETSETNLSIEEVITDSIDSTLTIPNAPDSQSIPNVNDVSVDNLGQSDQGRMIQKEKKENQRQKNKEALQNEESYQNRRGNLVPAKIFEFTNCNCHYKCSSTLKREDRENIFSRYWKLGSWDAQSSFIRSNTVLVSVWNANMFSNFKTHWIFVRTMMGIANCFSVFFS